VEKQTYSVMVEWNTCREDFVPDGALRDIYIHGTTITDWNLVYGRIQADYDLKYSVDGSQQPFPATVEEAFETRKTAVALLSVDIGGIIVNCHFFPGDEIEFDIDPSEVGSQRALDELLNFLKTIGEACKKPVSLTPENLPAHPIIIFDPGNSEFKYLPA
jgi:hypothetical protein